MNNYKRLLTATRSTEKLTTINITKLVNEISKFNLGVHSKDEKYMQHSPLVDVRSFIIKEVNWNLKCSGDYTTELPEFIAVLMDIFKCDKEWIDKKLQRSYYTELYPGKVIKPHSDGNHIYFDKVDRFHIYMSEEDEQVDLYCNNQRLDYKLGEVWRFDLSKEHWAKNNSDMPMKLFVFDLLRDGI